MDNAVLSPTKLPKFSSITTEQVLDKLEELLSDNRAQLTEILAEKSKTWENVVYSLEAMSLNLDIFWSQVSLIESVNNTPEFHEVYEQALMKLSDYQTEMVQNEQLYQAYCDLRQRDAELDAEQKRLLDLAIKDFELSGIALPAKDKKTYKELCRRSSELESQFSQNVLDCSKEWTYEIIDEGALKGLPEHAVAAAREKAQQKGLKTWIFDLSMPSYLAVMTSSDERSIREAFYRAFVSRASNVGPHNENWDNSHVMEEIVKLRLQLAQLLGYKNYAEYSLSQKMAKEPKQVMEFLHQLLEASRAQAVAELDELRAFAKQQGHDDLQPWDLAYFSEKLCQARFTLTQESLRPYFPIKKVLSGLFSIIERLFDLKIVAEEDFDKWHDKVLLFRILDKDQVRGWFYLDLYARATKRSGAWMSDGRSRFRDKTGQVHSPFAYIVCNFSEPLPGKTALLTHDEVLTLFHEVGHGLHHTLTTVNYPSMAGCNHVAWDAVELPSQFLENWCWEEDALKLISEHYETKEALSSDKLNNLKASRDFQAGLQMLRQLEFSLFDFELHQTERALSTSEIQNLLDEIRKQTAVLPAPNFNRFQHSFSHIFAGGYAAGYYSYKWAEVLSADAFSRFEDEGLFNQQTGLSYLHEILEKGGSQDAMDLFIAFRGRPPEITALLRHCGLGTAQN